MTPLKVGAALMIETIAEHKDWLTEADRDLEIQDFIFYEAYKDGWQDTVGRAKSAIDGFSGRLGIHGPFPGFHINTTDPEVRDIVSRRLVHGVEAAAALGAQQMVIHSPFDNWSHHHRLAGKGGNGDIIDAIRAVIDPALKLGEEHGVTMVVENCFDVVPEDRRGLIEAVSSKALALSIDTGHAHLARYMSGGPPVDCFVRDAGDLLKHVHIQDLDGYADRHWAPGDGSIEWPAVFKALAECDSAPHLVLELRDHKDVPKGFAHLKDLGLVV